MTSTEQVRAGRTASEIQYEMVRAAMARDFDSLRSLYHPDYVYTDADGSERAGIDAAIEVVRTFTTAFPDYDVEIERHFQPTDDVSIMQFRARGTHRGEFEGIAATDRPIDYPGVNIVEVRDGLIHREREYYDNLAIMVQLGVVEA